MFLNSQSFYFCGWWFTGMYDLVNLISNNLFSHLRLTSSLIDLPIFLQNSISSKSKPVHLSLTRFSTKAEIMWKSVRFFRKDFEERFSAVLMSFSSKKKITGQPACFSFNWRHRFSVRFLSSAKFSAETGIRRFI